MPVRQRVDAASAGQFNRFGYGRVHMDFVLAKPDTRKGLGMGKYIMPQSPESIGVILGGMGSEAPASGAWGVANGAIAFPIWLTEPFWVRSLWVANGAAVAGNLDMGIYDEKFRKILSCGATAQAGVSVLQRVAVPVRTLEAGQYWIALVKDDVVGRVMRQTSLPAPCQGAAMGLGMAAAYPLPATFVGLESSAVYVPVFGISSIL